jgi:hypothetical protein
VSSALLNIVIGLVTSVLSGSAVLLWRRVASSRILHRKAAFFGLRPGRPCLIVMNNHWQLPGSASHDDVHVMLEIAALAQEAGCRISVIPADDLRERAEDSVEFCIGGPLSNPRTAAHLASYLPGVKQRPISVRSDSGAIMVGRQKFAFKRGKQEYALVAKFTPVYSSCPVIVIYGQRAINSRAAINFLKHNYRTLSKTVESVSKFCLIIQVTSSDAYGPQAAELAADVTSAAFIAPEHPSAATAATASTAATAAMASTAATAATAGPDLRQGHGDGVQGKAHAGPDHRAVDADELQVAPE